MFADKGFEKGIKKRQIKAFTKVNKKYFPPLGDPEFCLNKPQTFYEVPATVSLTVCGVPGLSVLWKNENTGDAALIVGKPYANLSYANTYSFDITKSMCGKRLHFIAVNYNGAVLVWSPIMKFICKFLCSFFRIIAFAVGR